MMGRFKYVGAVGLLLTLACGPKVEIGHGEGGSAGEASGGTHLAVGGTSGSGVDGGAPPDQPVAGGPTSSGGTGVAGPIPSDDGPQAEVGKVDLLLAVDNSPSMAQKQKLFAKALPELVKRLVNPRCVSATGEVVDEPASADLDCPAGSKREFEALRDLHVGVITSSLGSHGASGMRAVCGTPGDDDHAHLIPTVRSGVASYDATGYLKWDPDGKASPPGESDPQAFADALGAMIDATGEHGCGYEAQLESVYRFLVDPSPPQAIVFDGIQSHFDGVDEELLAQRDGFLRPDSSVVVLMLTDENDCSIVDEGYGWLVSHAQPMYKANSTCAIAPNDPCCQSCAETVANPGCPPLADDAECQKGKLLSQADDDLNLRCWDQKRRFGFSLLYPTERYVRGFGDAEVRDRDGTFVKNPLFHRGGKNRDRSLFTLAVIGGVPWQDLATPSSLASDELDLMTNAQLTAAKRWPVILGDLATFTPPSDPFMHEQAEERSGKNPVTNDPIVASGSSDPRANAINGHEQANMGNRDLQYACTFELPEPISCETREPDGSCDCYEDDLPFGRSVCQPPAGGAVGTTEYYGKAYPTLRELDVARQLGRRSVLGSICSRNTQDDARGDYGYRPVFNAIGRRVAETLTKP